MGAGRNLVQATARLKWALAVLVLASLLAPLRAHAQDRDPDRVPVTLLASTIGAFAGGGTALVIYDPFQAYRRDIASNPETLKPPIVYCLPHAGGVAAGFLLGAGVGLLVPATLATQIVELVLLGVVMLTDFYIMHVVRKPPEDEPEGPPLWPESATTLRLEIYF